MFIVPVIDVRKGVAVQAVAGHRAQYRPLESCLTSQATPSHIARAYAEQLQCKTIYVADLDALMGDEPQWEIFPKLIRNGASLWIDAAIASAHRAEQIQQHLGDQQHRLIVAAETLPSGIALEDISARCGCDQVIFSLDLRKGRLNTAVPEWQSCSVLSVVEQVVACGIERIIVLDLADVGVSNGTSTLALLREIIAAYPHLKIIAGGGVRNMADLLVLEQAGCTAALVATALHKGWLTRLELAQFAHH
jgi:phosphoribosylformimino-5-aminoimidazole carboxamide ribotide isomerase